MVVEVMTVLVVGVTAVRSRGGDGGGAYANLLCMYSTKNRDSWHHIE